MKTEPNVRLFVGWVSFAARRVGDLGLDLGRRPRREPVLDARDHLAVPQVGVAVREAELGGREPTGAVRSHDERSLEDRRPVAAVRAGVHPDAAPGRARDRTRELEAAQARRAGAVEANGVRGGAAGDEQAAIGFRRR